MTIDVEQLRAQIDQLKDTTGLLRAHMARAEEQRRNALDVEDRAFNAGVEALRRALLVEFAGDAQAEAIIRRCSPESR